MRAAVRRRASPVRGSFAMESLFADWLGTPVWFWLAFIAIVIALTAFDLGILHRASREMGIAESLRLSALSIGLALAFVDWIWAAKGSERTEERRLGREGV